MKVAVLFGPVQISRDFIDYPYFADLGAIQAAATLRAAGAGVTLADAFALPGSTLAPSGSGDLVLGAPEDEVFRALPSEADVFVVALTPFHRPPARDASLGGVLARLRRDHPRVPIVLADLYQSGQHVVDAPSSAILASYPEADVLLRHEPEADLPAIVADLAQHGRPASPYARAGAEPSPLDALPLPAWDLVDLPAYFTFHERVVAHLGRPTWAFPITGRCAPVLTSRGCPYRCVHCSSNPSARRDGVPIAPKTQRRYSPAYLDRLFADLASRGVQRVHLLDELVNVNEAHFDAVLALLQKHGLSFEIPNGVRADYVLDRHLAAMRGRLTTLSVSAESGVQRVIDRIVDKQLDLSAIRSVAERAEAAGVPLLVHFMIGLPGETREEVNGTLDFALDLAERTGAIPSVQFATPLPGTRLARMAEGKVALPVVRDYGPLFQQEPSIETSDVTLDFLRRARWTFDERIRTAATPPRVVLNLTYRCNNRCAFCTTGTGLQVDGDHEEQQALLVEYRKRGAAHLSLDGGEPTLSDRLFRIVALARKLGYTQIDLTTNARMASYRAYAERLVKSGLTSIHVSIHGPDAATHTENVLVPEAFEQTCSGARNLVELAPPHVELGAKLTVTRSNHEKLLETAELVLALGLRRLEIQFLTPFGPATPSILPDTERAAREVMRLIDAFSSRLKILVQNLPFCFLPGYEKYISGDAQKIPGHVLLADTRGVDQLEYVRRHRVKKPVCEGCPHTVFCDGFLDVEGSSEPPWLVTRPAAISAPTAPP